MDTLKRTLIETRKRLEISTLGTMLNQKTWSELMLDDYVLKHSHYTFSTDEKALVLERLQEDYVITTFGPDGLNKTTCDFFYCLQVTAGLRVTKTWVKTGDTLRWNYGDGNIYSQTALPGEISTGVISVTSTDGFEGVTRIILDTNTFFGALPAVSIAPNLQRYLVQNNLFTGSIPAFTNKASTTQIDVSNNYLTGTLPEFGTLPELDYFLAHINDLDGVVPSTDNCPKLRLLRVYNSQSSPTRVNRISDVTLTGGNPLLAEINLLGCTVSTAKLDLLVHNLATYYTANTPTVNLILNFTNTPRGHNGYITGGESNTDVIALRAAFTSASKTLTLTYESTLEAKSLSTGMVAFTCDDGYGSQFNLARPMFLLRNKRFTIFKTSGDAYPVADKLSWADALTMETEGFYIGGHSKTHPNYVTLTEAQLREELEYSDAAFLANGLTSPIRHEAYPYGHNGVNDTIVEEYRLSARDTTAGVIDKVVDLMVMPNMSIDVTDSTNLRVRLALLDYAKNANLGIIPMFHMVKTEYGIATSIHIDMLTALLDYAISINLQVVTIPELYAEIIAL